MTRDKAVSLLSQMFLIQFSKEEYEALAMAIEALNNGRKTELQTTDYCNVCNHKGCDNCVADEGNPYCVPSRFELKAESSTDCAWK